MARFRKRPVEVDAFQWTGGPDQAEDPVWIAEAIDAGTVQFWATGTDPDNIRMWIRTLEGTLMASVGDWIIRGTKGEIYPCKPDIFAEIYELVDG